nr:hypothetical protein [Tanacetum cinerariifolium]
MSLTFADTHNMVAYLNKSDASEGFNQVIDFLNGSYIKYALTVNLNIYVSFIKQFWNTVVVKQTNDITRLQALVDRKKVVIMEAAIRDSMSAKCTSWNEFSSAMASAVICLSTGVIEEEGDAEEQVTDVVVDDAAAHEADTTEALDACAAFTRRVKHLKYDKVAQALEITKLKRRVKKLENGNKVRVLKLRKLQKVGTPQRIDTLKDIVMEDASNQGRMIDDLDKDDAAILMDDKEEEKKEEEEDDPAKVQEVVDVVTTAKLMKYTTISATEPQVLAAAKTIAAPVRVVAASTRRRKGVVIRDPEEESTTIIPADTKSKDKEESKPMKKMQQVKMDEEYARKLHEELNKDIDWDVAIEHVKQKAKEDPSVQRYQNVAGFRLDRFKGKFYDDIRPIFEANQEKETDEEVEDLKNHLEIVPDENDDVYTEDTLLARKVPVVDYEIIHLNNKPHYKIIRADGTHQLYVRFLTLLKNFDREDLESLWSLVKERFSTFKPNNFSDDFLLTTLGAMFERPDGQAQVWKNQRTVHGQAKVKS